jgi:hypothetical protein
MYSGDYGKSCKVHKEPGQSACFDLTKTPPVELETGQADWCTQPWCYVDPCACDQADITKSDYFPTTLHFSYATCGGKNTYSEFMNALDAVGTSSCTEVAADCKAVCPEAYAAADACKDEKHQAATMDCLKTQGAVCTSYFNEIGGSIGVPLMCKMQEAGCAAKALNMTKCTSAALKPHALVMLDCLGALQKQTLADNATTCCPFFQDMLDCRGQTCVDYSSVQAKASWTMTGQGTAWSKVLKGLPMFKEQSAACDGISVLGTEAEVDAMIATMKAAVEEVTAAAAAAAAAPASGSAPAGAPAAAATTAAPATTKAPAAVADFAAPTQSAPIIAMVAAITMSVTANEML